MDVIKKISNEVLVERIDNLSNLFGREVKDIKEQIIGISGDLRNLKENFPTRSELQAMESRLRTPIEKLLNTVYGPDGSDGMVTKLQSTADNVQTIYKIIAIYVAVNSSILGFIIWQLFKG